MKTKTGPLSFPVQKAASWTLRPYDIHHSASKYDSICHLFKCWHKHCRWLTTELGNWSVHSDQFHCLQM